VSAISDAMTKKRHSRLRVFASPKKKSHRPVGTPEDCVVLRESAAGSCREDAPLAPTRARDRPRRAAASRAARPARCAGARAGLPRRTSTPAREDGGTAAGGKCVAVPDWQFSNDRDSWRCDATDARPRPREDARRERRGRTKPDREERAVRDAAFRATTRAAREGSRRDAPPKPRVTTPRFPCARKAPVPRKFRRTSAPETGHVGARDVPLVSVAGVRVRAPARVSGAALCDRP